MFVMDFTSKTGGMYIPLTSDKQSMLMNIEKYEHNQVSAFADKLSRLKDNYWIKCTCNPRALLIICNLHGKIYIRCKLRNVHNIDCPFIQRNVVIQ